MRFMILGCAGQLGAELVKILETDAVAYPRNELDISDRTALVRRFQSDSVDVVINAAAYTHVDQAEDEPEFAFRINALGPRNLAQLCAEYDIPLVHVSSDYVFGQQTSDRPWLESDCPGPINVYGASKLAGENFVRSISRKHFVLRTCGLYGHNTKGNFVETMLRLAKRQNEVTVVDDQFCTPTSAMNLANVIVELCGTTEYGLYHATNLGECSWARFAKEIFSQSKLSTKVIQISSSEYPTKASRPKYSVLDSQKLNNILSSSLASWEDALAEYLANKIESTTLN